MGSVVTSLPFLMLLICVFFLIFFFKSVWPVVYQFYWSFQRTCFLFHWFFSIIFVFNLLIIAFISSAWFGIICSYFCCFLNWRLELLIWGLSFQKAFHAVNFHLKHCFSCILHILVCCTLFNSKYFLISLGTQLQ